MAKLIINDEREIEITDSVISIGRVSDNAVSLSGDSNVSRYHAEIERRGEDFWLIDLNSVNGTTLNGTPVTSEKLLHEGDVIVLGNSAKIQFQTNAFTDEQNTPAEISAPQIDTNLQPPTSAEIPLAAADTENTKKFPLFLIAMGVICGLAVISVAAVLLIPWKSAEKPCAATAEITSPETGDTISKETDVSVSVKNADCVKRAVFVIDGKEFANATSEPYEATVDPAQFGDLSDGQMHALRVVLEDEKGNKIPSRNEVALIFETLADEPPPAEEIAETQTNQTAQPVKTAQNKKASAIQTQEMSLRLTKQFSKSFAYKFDPQFVEEVRKKTAEYTAEGYFARAQKYRDLINTSFVQEQNLDAPLGYLLAMSRSKFNPQKQGQEEGLWQMSNEFAAANSLNGMCGTETLSDAAQTCAAKAVALYLKSVALNVFEGDTIYTVAAFGMSPQEAANWKSTLPADRSDFWKIIKSAKQREEIVRFFAAGIVAENPQVFGLKKDRPLSELYRNLIVK